MGQHVVCLILAPRNERLAFGPSFCEALLAKTVLLPVDRNPLSLVERTTRILREQRRALLLSEPKEQLPQDAVASLYLCAALLARIRESENVRVAFPLGTTPAEVEVNYEIPEQRLLLRGPDVVLAHVAKQKVARDDEDPTLNSFMPSLSRTIGSSLNTS